MNWENLFKSHILERGYDYFKDDRVEILRQTDEVVEAFVAGSEDYQVNIYFEDGKIEDMYCDCPYACDQKNCKHMAAVLYALDDISEVSDPALINAETLADEASPELIREFLIKSLTYNEDLKYKFIRFLKTKRNIINISEYREYLNDLIIQYSEGSYYIDYRYAFQFFNEADELLTECTDILIAEKRYYDAYAILKYYYYKLSITDIDDDGNLCIFHDTCMDIFRKITELADIDSKRKIFDELINMLGPKFNHIFDMVFEFISTGFEEEEFLRKMLDFTDKKLEINVNHNQRKMWIVYRIKLMDKLDYSDDDIMDYSRKHPDYREIKNCLTEIFIANGNSKAAIRIIEDILESAENDIYESKQLHLNLKELYKKINAREKYLRELWILLTEFHITTIDIYHEYKSLYDVEEWENVRERLYSSMKNQFMLPEYFIEEKLYDRLTNYIISTKDIFLIKKYESYLTKEHSEFILAKYAESLNKEAEHTADRLTYHRWADILIHMKTLKGGKECVMEIIKKWRKIYRNRPAMMQELDRAVYEK